MNNLTEIILPFSNVLAGDMHLVGGKGANLGEMTHAGFPIPPGFCITTAAFEQFIDSSVRANEIYATLDSITANDLNAVRHAGEQIRTTLLDVPFPEEVADAVRNHWQKAGPEQPYAVRSSATAEDLPDASFAGQQDTYLNVIGEASLLDAIRRCWASLFTDRAILYRVKNNFPHRDVQLAVIVQKMVPADISGILFTADPLTGHRHTLTIDASYGLGEALVSGVVTPDTYKIDKRTHTVLEKKTADKEIAIFPEQQGGTRQEALSDLQRKQTVLTDDQILSLSQMGAKIESHYGTPQDIEWAIADQALYILQSRPITSLYPIDGLKSPDDSLHVFFSMGHQQNMTRAMTPLSLSSFPNFIPPELRSADGTIPILRFSGGRLFIDLTLPLRHPILKRILPLLLSQFDLLIPQVFQLATRRSEFKGPHGLKFSFGTLKGIFSILRRLFHALWRRDLTGFIPQTNALIDEFIIKAGERLRVHSPGKSQILAMLDQLPTAAPFFLNWVPEAAAGIAASRLLPKFGKRWLTPDKLEALTLGVPGNVVNQMNLMLSDLAELARKSPSLAEQFNHLDDDPNLWLQNLAGIEGSAPLIEGWNEFLAAYGARAQSEIEISIKRWYEDPTPVLRVISGNIEKNASSRALFEAQAREREAVYTELLAVSGKGLFGGLRLRLFKRLYHVLLNAGGMREHHKLMMVRMLAVVRDNLKKNAADLVSAGKLSNQNDIWFLSWSELLSIWEDNETPWKNLAAQRQADLARYQKFTPPVVITSDGESPIVQFHVEDAPPGALLGNPVSPGTVEGPVRVIHDPAVETLEPGEVLVAPFTDPGWTPLFINAAALVMDIGGVLAHGSVVAREYGIPAVVGVRGASLKLQTGQRVRVDGNRGIIEIL